MRFGEVRSDAEFQHVERIEHRLRLD